MIVIGAGVIGLSTAYFLRRHGADVTVLERRERVGLGTSYANGSLLTPSMSEPWNSPGVHRQLLRLRGREQSAVLLRARALPSILGWGIRFLQYSTPPHFAANTLKNTRLAQYSLAQTMRLCEQEQLECNFRVTGTLRVFRDAQSLRNGSEAVGRLQRLGLASAILSPRETVQLEPRLAPIEAKIAGALHNSADAIGNAHAYCGALANTLARLGVQLNLSAEVLGWRTRGDRVAALQVSCGELGADVFVLAAASESVSLAAKIGVDIPVRPVKGYSITVAAGPPRPMLPVIDDDLHAAVVPIGDQLRVAGTAEFTGYDLTVTGARIDNLLRILSGVYPNLAPTSRDAIRPWAGLRPMCADGVPVIGRSPYQNLFISTGHGPLGWTMAAGSGRALADYMMGLQPEVPLADYRLDRF